MLTDGAGVLWGEECQPVVPPHVVSQDPNTQQLASLPGPPQIQESGSDRIRDFFAGSGYEAVKIYLLIKKMFRNCHNKLLKFTLYSLKSVFFFKKGAKVRIVFKLALLKKFHISF